MLTCWLTKYQHPLRTMMMKNCKQLLRGYG
jgi:hypothetical protein